MLLIEETIRKFGYDPTPILARGVDSLKPIVRQCENFGKIQDSTIRWRNSLCNAGRDHANGVMTEYWKSSFKPVSQSTANSKGGNQEIAVQKTGIA